MNIELIDDAARAAIGVTHTGTHLVVAREFQRWALATADDNPLYFDAEVARRHGHPAVVMPPLYLASLVRDPAGRDDLGPDGRRLDAMPIALPRSSRVMAGGEQYRFVAALHDGDVVVATRRLDALTQKSGRSGPFVVVASVVEVHRDDVLVAELRQTVLAFP